MKDSPTCIRKQADKQQITRCKTLLNEHEEGLKFSSKQYELAGNTVRLSILFLLKKEGRLCVCDLSDILGMTVPAVSQHLRKLKDREMISSQKEGQTIYYSLEEKAEWLVDALE